MSYSTGSNVFIVYEQVSTPPYYLNIKVHFPDTEVISSCQTKICKPVPALG